MLLCLAWMALTVVQKPSPSFVIVDHGTPKSRIILGANASPSDKRAAQVLDSAIFRMSGVTLPIQTGKPGAGRISIGIAEAPGGKNIPSDGFAIVCTPTSLNITSGGKKGSIYAVIDLLEKQFHCRCYSPTVQIFPRQATLTVPLGLTVDQPVNTFRVVNGDFSDDPTWLDWQRLNTTSEVFGSGYYVHTFHKLVPPETYLATHPELFALIGGRRTPEQICPSRPENVDIAFQTLKQAMDSQPDKQVWSVSQNDNEDYCHCPDCLKVIDEEGSPSGPILRFVNAIAKRFPNKTISTLAYEYSRKAPRVTKPDPNVQVMLCTIELSRTLPIATEPTSAGFRDDIVNWGKICNNIYLWDYTVDFSHQISPFPNLDVLQPNLKFFVENNARQQFEQTNTSPGHEFSELKSYLLARLLWNPDVNVQATVNDFLYGYYGAAAPAISAYISNLQRSKRRWGTRLDIFERPNAHQNDFLAARSMQQYNGLFTVAENAVAKDPVLLQRVKVARLPIEYATLAIAAESVFGPRGFFREYQGAPQQKPAMTKLIDDFETVSKENHVRSVNESNLKPSEFCAAIRRLLNLETSGNLAFRKAVAANPSPSLKYGRGDVSLLTNGVHGSTDFGIQWLGWEGIDFDVVIDLGSPTTCHELITNSLSVQRSWILHPKAISCEVSTDGVKYDPAGTRSIDGDARTEPLLHEYKFVLPSSPTRYVKLHVTGTKTLPAWHPGAGGKSWVFLDEIVVR